MNSRMDKRTHLHAITASGRLAGTLAALTVCLLLAGCKTGGSFSLPWKQASADPSPDVSEFAEPAPVVPSGNRPEMRQPDSVALASYDTPSPARPAMASHVPGGVVKVNSATFEEQVLRSDVPVLVDFSATWCGPCKRLEPRLEELARETPGAKVVKVDIEESPDIAARYDVGPVPSLRVIRDGQVTASHVGLMSKEELKSLLGLPGPAP